MSTTAKSVGANMKPPSMFIRRPKKENVVLFRNEMLSSLEDNVPRGDETYTGIPKVQSPESKLQKQDTEWSYQGLVKGGRWEGNG